MNNINDSNKINKLNERIVNLNNQNEELNKKLKRFPFVLEENEQLMTIIISSLDHSFQYPMICKNTSTINDLEKELYKQYPELSYKENYFLCKGKLINKFETFESNNIQNGDILIINQKDD